MTGAGSSTRLTRALRRRAPAVKPAAKPAGATPKAAAPMEARRDEDPGVVGEGEDTLHLTSR